VRAIVISIVLVFSLPYAVRPSDDPGQTPEVPGQRVVRVQKTGLTRDEEVQLGERAAAKAEEKLKLIHSADVEQWLSQVGEKLGGTPEARAYTYRFKLVANDQINATPFPGGLIYVNSGVLAAANSESEVAAVLAHQMSHVALRHGAAKETKQKEWKTALQVAGIAAGVAGVHGRTDYQHGC
jgi:beta-barrel assembly-enhancing protease